MARLNAANDVSIEILRRKYAAQNRAIAKSHAALESKVSQLEDMVSSLIAENYELRCENMSLRQSRGGMEEVTSFIREKLGEIEAFLGGEEPLPEAISKVSSGRRKRRLGGIYSGMEDRQSTPEEPKEDIAEEPEVLEDNAIFEASGLNESTLPTIVEDSDGERVPLKEKKNIANANNTQSHARKKLKTAPSENETMPKSSPKRRRSRGNRVNYALPSLRTKMRREQDELVDAVIETNQPKKEEDSSEGPGEQSPKPPMNNCPKIESPRNGSPEKESSKEYSPEIDSDAENIEPPVRSMRRRRSSKIHTTDLPMTRTRRSSRRSSVAKPEETLVERRQSRRRSTLAPTL